MKIWISYSFADKEFVSVLKTQLQNAQLEVVDYDNAVMFGDNIEDSIYNSISTADALLIVLSKNSSDSLFTEMGIIISEIKNNHNKKFIPILLDTQISIPLFIKSYKYLDLTNNRTQEEQIEQLIEMLKIFNQYDIIIEKKKNEYVKKSLQRQWTLFVTLLTTIMTLVAVIITFIYAGNNFFSFDIDKNIVMYVVSAAIAVFAGVFFSIFFQLLKKK